MTFPAPKLPLRMMPVTSSTPDAYQEALDQDQKDAVAGLRAAKLGLLKARTDAERERYGAEIAKYRAETRLSQEQLARVEAGEPGQSGQLTIGGLVTRMLDKTEDKVERLEGQLGDLSGQLVETQLGTLQTQIAELKTKMANPATAPSLKDIMDQVHTWNNMVKEAAKELADSHTQAGTQPPARDASVEIQLAQLANSQQLQMKQIELQILEMQGAQLVAQRQHELEMEKFRMEREDKKLERTDRLTQNQEMLNKAESILMAISSALTGHPIATRVAHEEPEEQRPAQVINAVCSTEGCGEKFPVPLGANPVTCPKCHKEQALEWPADLIPQAA